LPTTFCPRDCQKTQPTQGGGAWAIEAAVTGWSRYGNGA
jgi:hypothetical protein